MGRYTPAYSRFIERLAEVQDLQKLAQEITNLKAEPRTISRVNALCRSSVVILSSHIEGYIEDLAETAIDNIAGRQIPKAKLAPGFRYFLSYDLIRKIKTESKAPKVESFIEDLLKRDGHIWDTNPNYSAQLSADTFVKSFANPYHSRIRDFFSRFGYVTFNEDLQSRLVGDYTACINMISQVIVQRNRIAHGDMVVVGTPSDLYQMIALVKQYCREADCAVGDWFRGQGCPIR